MHLFGLIITPSSIALILIGAFTFIYWNKTIFDKQLLLLLVFLGCSIISSYINRGQGLLYTTLASTNIFGIFYIFTYTKKYSANDLEKSIFWLSFIYCFLYLLQFFLLKYGIQICKVIVASEINNNRFRLPGSAFASLVCFFAMNKILIYRKERFKYICLLVLGLLVVILMAFRSLTVLLILFLLFLMLRIKGLSFKTIWYLVGMCTIVMMLSFIPVVNDNITYMIDKQVNGSETFNDDSYIRFVSFQYYTNNYFNNIWEVIFGTGMPYGEKGSSYARLHSQLREAGLFYVDWGLLGFSCIVGILTVVTMIFYSVKAYFIKVTKEYYYLGVWFIFFVCSSILTMEFFRDGNFVVQALVLALVYKCNLKKYYNENRNINIL